MKNYYKILGIEFPSSQEEIKKEYRKLAKLFHPDIGGDIEKMQELSEAYSVLSSPQKKSEYDRLYQAHDVFKKHDNTYSVYSDYSSHSSNPKWHRNSREQELKLEFSLNNQNSIKYYENKIVDLRCYDRSYSLEERISFFENCIKAYYEFKEFCYQNPGSKIYFQDMWEYGHNSKNDCIAFVETLMEEKQKLEKRLEKERTLEQLKKDLYETLNKEHPILQSKLFLRFPPQHKNIIKRILTEWVNNDIISKEKCGNSYMIDTNVSFGTYAYQKTDAFVPDNKQQEKHTTETDIPKSTPPTAKNDCISEKRSKSTDTSNAPELVKRICPKCNNAYVQKLRCPTCDCPLVDYTSTPQSLTEDKEYRGCFTAIAVCVAFPLLLIGIVLWAIGLWYIGIMFMVAFFFVIYLPQKI